MLLSLLQFSLDEFHSNNQFPPPIGFYYHYHDQHLGVWIYTPQNLQHFSHLDKDKQIGADRSNTGTDVYSSFFHIDLSHNPLSQNRSSLQIFQKAFHFQISSLSLFYSFIQMFILLRNIEYVIVYNHEI